MTTWALTFEDHFDSPTLDTTKWQTGYRWGQRNEGNGEAQYYVDDAITISDSILHLTARHEAANGRDYQSGMIASWGKFAQQYGRFEVRALCSFYGGQYEQHGRGFWPAIWMLPESPEYWGTFHPVPEIDLMELEGSVDYFMWHGVGWGQYLSYKENVGGDNLNRLWHIYRMDWTPEGIAFYVDGVKTGQCPDPPNSRAIYLIVNLAIGDGVVWPPAPDATSVFPGSFDIDYIRVWQHHRDATGARASAGARAAATRTATDARSGV